MASFPLMPYSVYHRLHTTNRQIFYALCELFIACMCVNNKIWFTGSYTHKSIHKYKRAFGSKWYSLEFKTWHELNSFTLWWLSRSANVYRFVRCYNSNLLSWLSVTNMVYGYVLKEKIKKKKTAVSKAWNSIANQEHKSTRKVKYTLKIYKI